MISPIDSHIHYRHTWEEVAALTKAIAPLGQSIHAVGTTAQRAKMHAILGCEYFRKRDAVAMKNMLLKACKYTRAHMGDCFEFLRDSEISAAENLEEAVAQYWKTFQQLEAESLPTY